MKKILVSLSCILFSTLLMTTKASAHGGVSIEADKCVLTIGQYLMHFTGYQPESSGGEEFCEDIPNTGHAIIVMDFVGAQLRKLDTTFRIVQTDTWNEAQAYKLGDEAKEIVHMPAKKYPGGSITFDYNFPEAGYFVGIVTTDGGRKLESLFPFSVGYGIGTFSGAGGGRNQLILVLGIVLLAGGVGYYFWSSKRKGQVPEAA